MLILSRRVGESIKFDDEVSMTVLSIRGNQVRLGISAPWEIKVMREEIYDKNKEKQNLRSTN